MNVNLTKQEAQALVDLWASQDYHLSKGVLILSASLEEIKQCDSVIDKLRDCLESENG